MSQAGVLGVGGTPSVPTNFDADSGIAVPVANTLNVIGDDTTANNVNGIFTTGAGNTLSILLTNRVQGSGSTVGAVTTDIITLVLSIPGTYTFQVNISAFEDTTPAGAGYSIFGTVRTDGANAVLVGTPDKIVNEEAALSTGDANIVVSGNNAIVRVTGTVGLTTLWNGVGYYVLRS
jgi:hypothetical protein